MKLSIIVPMYNSSKTIERCLDSIVETKNLCEIETIIIDDGSNDESYFLVKKYTQKYTNFKCIKKENGGVSEARNVGICESSGEWVTFVDSDDILAQGAIDTMIESIQNNPDAEMYIFSINIEKDELINLSHDMCSKYIQGVLKCGDSANLSNYHLASPCSKLYKKSVLDNNNISFINSVKIGEDMLFNIEYIKNINRLALVSKGVYIYLRNANSAMNTYMKDIISSDRNFLLSLITAIEEYSFPINEVALGGIWMCLVRYFAYVPLKNYDIYFTELNNLVSNPPYYIFWKDYDIRFVKDKKRRIIFKVMKKRWYLTAIVILKIYKKFKNTFLKTPLYVEEYL